MTNSKQSIRDSTTNTILKQIEIKIENKHSHHEM